MKFVSRIALGAALALGGVAAGTLPATVAVAQDEDAEAYSPDFSRKFVKPISEAQTAIQAGDFAAATASLAEAEAVAEKPDDFYYLNQFRFNVADKTGDVAIREAAIHGMLDSNSKALPAQNRMIFLQELGRLALERGDQAAATQYFEKLIAANPNDATAVFNVAVLQLQAGDEVGSLSRFQRAIQLTEATGVPADPSWYRQVLKIAYDNERDIVQPSLALVRAYPTQEHWRDALVLFRDGAQLKDQADLDVFRLLHDVRALVPQGMRNGQTTRSDYIDYADSANTLAYVGEADAILKEAKAIGDDGVASNFAKEVETVVKERLNSDRRELPSLAKEAASEATGRLALSTASAFLGYGENAEAARLYRLALEKGGINAPETNIRLGIALSREGDIEGARQAFAAVTSGAPGALARFWEVHLDKMQNAPAPATAPAAAPASDASEVQADADTVES